MRWRCSLRTSLLTKRCALHFSYSLLLSIPQPVTRAQGYISTSHMQWFMEAEGSRNYEDEAAMSELLRKLDTNGDGKVISPPPPAVTFVLAPSTL